MKQRWLIKPPKDESTLRLEVDSQTQLELVALMAAAIEALHLLQADTPRQTTEAATDEYTATAPQD
jgi:hypothetical protein